MAKWRYGSAIIEMSTKWNEWSASRLDRLTPQYPLDKRLGVPHTRSGRRGEHKTCPCRRSNPHHPVHRYTNSAIPTPVFLFTHNLHP
jgi:hypothetical protein